MANDRLYLRCKRCKEILLLSKVSSNISFVQDSKKIEKWLQEHLWCSGDIENIPWEICNEFNFVEIINEGSETWKNQKKTPGKKD